MTTRANFIRAAGSMAAIAAVGDVLGNVGRKPDYACLQEEIDAVTPAQFFDYLKDGKASDLPALKRLDWAFEKVSEEIRSTVVTGKPAVWFVYNMGVVIKTPKACFSIDLQHRYAGKMASALDFALISHNHVDHFTEEFYQAMNGAGKTVISNFKDNYGVRDRKWGGYTRANKVFKLADVEIRTSLTDHNPYLVDFTTVFEIEINGFRIVHSGDCFTLSKLNPRHAPDLWFVHPRCGMKVAEMVRKFGPKLTVIAHMNELGHAKGNARWTFADGLEESAKVENAGAKSVMPFWGDRIA